MPQFDVFTFLSQLFWLFLFFSIFFVNFIYYLLPSLAVTLKVRRRKLLFASTAVSSTAVTNFTDSLKTNVDVILGQSKKQNLADCIEKMIVFRVLVVPEVYPTQ